MNAQAVAEHTIMLMLSLLRFLRIDDLNTREGKQIEVKEHHMLIGDLKELGECTIGLIGYGDIGQATAKLLVPFGSKILYYQPSGRNPHDTISEYCPLDQLLAQSDIVSLHLPSNNKTKDMVNDDFFKKMKKGSILINTSRGDIVSSSALLNSLKNGTLFGAGLDCISNEPIRKDNPIFNADQEILDKIIFTPHTAGVTSSSFKRGYATIWHNIHSIENGTKPIHIVWEKK
jgi:phosphoglycerate dehydrogenase-like enzyme